MDGPLGPAATLVNNMTQHNSEPSLYLEELGQNHNIGSPDSVDSVAITPVASQLTNCYASKIDDLKELESLLNSWNLGEYFNFFVRMYI